MCECSTDHILFAMNPSESLDGDVEDSEIAYAADDDTAEVINIDDEDSAGL